MNPPVKVTWWGHASTTIELDGVRVLTDPVFTTRLAHLSRLGSPAPAIAARAADVVVISHLHRDHLHVPSLLMLPASTQIVAPRGASAALAGVSPRLAGRIHEVGAGDSVSFGPVTVEAVPAAHDGRRGPGSRFGGLALGYLLSGTRGATVWFAGDTGLFDGMNVIGPVPIAVVPIGGWGPTLGEGHLDPAQAVEAVRRVGAVDAVPMHYGTFWPTGLRWVHPMNYRRLFHEPGSRFAAEFGRVLPAARSHVLAPGGSVLL